MWRCEEEMICLLLASKCEILGLGDMKVYSKMLDVMLKLYDGCFKDMRLRWYVCLDDVSKIRLCSDFLDDVYDLKIVLDDVLLTWMMWWMFGWSKIRWSYEKMAWMYG